MLAALSLITAAIAGCSGGNEEAVATPSSVATAESTAAAPSSGAGGSGAPALAPPSLADLVARVQPSVVAIGTRVNYGLFGATGLGSGIVVDREGHILTNFHVVENATDVTVKLFDGTLAKAKLLGFDRGNDLAVLEVDLDDPGRLQPVEFGDSDAVRPGDFVFAIGNPFDYEFTVTAGIVSGVNRNSLTNAAGRPIRGIIQTDAAINPGNSGGPLLDASGRVVGINTAIENPSGARVFVGIGLAVPANTAKRFLPRMIEGEVIQHPQLGISGVALNEITAEDAGVDVTRGVYVVTVARGSAADEAGLRPASRPDAEGVLPRGGDIIVAIDGEDVSSVEELAAKIDQHDVGDEVELTVIRDGKELSLTATLQAWPE